MKTVLRKWALRLIGFVAALQLLYLVVANALLNGDFVSDRLNRQPERLAIQWRSAWTFLPGRLRIRELTARGRSPQQQWWASASQGNIRLALWSLPSGILQIERLEAVDATAGVRTHTLVPDAPVGPDGERIDSTRAWAFAINDARIGPIRVFDYNDYRVTGVGRVELDDLTVGLDGLVAMGRGLFELENGELTVASESVARALRARTELRLADFDPTEHLDSGAVQHVSGSLLLAGDITSYGFIDRYLTDTGWVELDGRGSLSMDVQVDDGVLLDGSALRIESPSLAVQLGHATASGDGERYRIQGQGGVRGAVRDALGEAKTSLEVELKDIVMRDSARDRVLLAGKTFRLLATSPHIDLSTLPAEPAVSMEWQDAAMENIAVLSSYLPEGLPLEINAGRARLNGHLDYADRSVTGGFDLTGDEIGATVFNRAVLGRLDLELIVKRLGLDDRSVDFSGTRMQMQAAGAASDNSESAALRTELRVVQGQLTLSASSDDLERLPGPAPLSGELQLEGSVANVDFLNGFLPDTYGLEIEGDGRMRSDMRLAAGRLLPGSTFRIESDKLVSRFLGFEASGAGEVSTELRPPVSEEQLRLQLSLRDMRVLKLDTNGEFLRGSGLQLAAALPAGGQRAAEAMPTVTMSWQDTSMPDVAVLNQFLPGQPPFSLRSGVARSAGRLQYTDGKISGSATLAGDKISGLILEKPVQGQLGLALEIKEADLASRSLDISGTKLRMQANNVGEGGIGSAPLRTEIAIAEARLASGMQSSEGTQPGGTAPISGLIRLDGTVANIDFLNAFLPQAQGLNFSGDGRLMAELWLSDGHIASGTRLEAKSANLVSRFLEFEASGAGLLTAEVQGDPKSPVGKIQCFLGSFGLRRLDASTPYLRGRNLEITTVGRRSLPSSSFRDLDTVIKLAAGEMPDISIYNAYLPADAGISIVSGRGSVAADFRLRGATGSGHVETRATDVEVRVKDQTIRGNLEISARLAEGNLEDMTFDAAGTRIRIEDGSLESARAVRDRAWWSQIDLEKGRMTWKRPLDLDASIALRLRDSGLLVHLFVTESEEHEWLDKLLTVNDVVGHGNLLIGDNSIVLRDAQLSAENLLVLANLRLAEETMRGGLYAKYGVLGLGVELEDDVRSWKLVRPRVWYEDFAAQFASSLR